MVRSLLGFRDAAHRRDLDTVVLTAKSPLYGMEKAEVLSLLGPTKEPDLSTIFYDVGYLGETGYLEEPFTLWIAFDESGQIAEIGVSD